MPPHQPGDNSPKPDAAKSGPELVIGLVGALGVPLDEVTGILEDALSDVGYDHNLVRVSELLHQFERWKDLPTSPLDLQIEEHQKAGNELRSVTGVGHSMADLAIAEIQRIREEHGEEKDQPLPSTAYIIRSLKHPEEVDLLRRVYGASFFLVAAYSPLADREHHLAREIAASRSSGHLEDYLVRARDLIQIDDAEDNRLGQGVRDTFPRADVFVSAHQPPELKSEIGRFIEILFGNTFRTPSRSEFAMFQAFSAALRSADLSRQVGAVIATQSGDVVAVGSNEVPKAGGGAYWEGDVGDARDFQRGSSSSHEFRHAALREVMKRLESKGWLSLPDGQTVDSIQNEALEAMESTLLMGSSDFSRAVHAEMAALLDAARRGVRVEGGILYSTTFPCHNCAKHIVAAGISRVEYIEPFPKSHATTLHNDSLVIDSQTADEHHVAFEPFVGVAPRRYADLFSKLNRRDRTGSVLRWKKSSARPRYPDSYSALNYPRAEALTLLRLKERLETAGIIDNFGHSEQ